MSAIQFDIGQKLFTLWSKGLSTTGKIMLLLGFFGGSLQQGSPLWAIVQERFGNFSMRNIVLDATWTQTWSLRTTRPPHWPPNHCPYGQVAICESSVHLIFANVSVLCTTPNNPFRSISYKAKLWCRSKVGLHCYKLPVSLSSLNVVNIFYLFPSL